MDLKTEVNRELTEHILPFWLNLRDEEYGGFYGYMSHDLVVDKSYDKGCILNSRILYFFSQTCRLLAEDGRPAAAADHAFAFLKEYCLDEKYGGVFWSVTYDGKIADSTKHTYNQAFAIYALSVYYQATGNRMALSIALHLFALIEMKCRDETGYLESFTRTWELEENDKLSENGLMADKTMNTLLHVVEAYTELYRVSANPEVAQALRKALMQFRDQIYNPEKQQLEVFFDGKLHTLSDLYSYGHDIEAS